MAKIVIEVELSEDDLENLDIESLGDLRWAVYAALNELDDEGHPTLPCREEDVQLSVELD